MLPPAAKRLSTFITGGDCSGLDEHEARAIAARRTRFALDFTNDLAKRYLHAGILNFGVYLSTPLRMQALLVRALPGQDEHFTGLRLCDLRSGSYPEMVQFHIANPQAVV